ncbi:MAG: malic enzyme-like NAD(P)-binding protein, partial [Chloroflexota bacterium]
MSDDEGDVVADEHVIDLISDELTLARAQRITDDMFMKAAHTLAHLVTESDLEQGSLYPAL